MEGRGPGPRSAIALRLITGPNPVHDNPIVSINERRVNDERRGSHLANIREERLLTETCLGLSHCRFEQTKVTYSLTASVRIDLGLMRVEKVIQFQNNTTDPPPFCECMGVYCIHLGSSRNHRGVVRSKQMLDDTMAWVSPQQMVVWGGHVVRERFGSGSCQFLHERLTRQIRRARPD